MSKICITTRMSEASRAKLTALGHTLVYCDSPSWEDKLAAAQGCVAVACRGGSFPAAFFEQLPELKILALPSAGFDNIDLDAASRCGVYVTNASGANAVSVAELAFFLMLGAAKRAGFNYNVVHDGNPWRGRKQPTFTEVSGKTVAVLGYGNIGREFARMCLGFNMRVIAYHPRIKEKELLPGLIPSDDLYDAVKDADFVSSHIPGSEKNNHLLNEAFFSHMKEGSVFINTGRGSVVDEAALLAALQSGHLAAAGLDVFEQEPLPADHPFLTMDNCVLTPHIGGETAEAKFRVYDLAAENVVRVLTNRAPLTPVNRI